MANRQWLLAAVATSAAVVLSAPLLGQLRSVLRRELGDGFVLFMAAAVGIASLGALAAAVRHIRTNRERRYAAVAAAFTVAVSYALAAATGDSEVDAVERFHFVEYGAITALFYAAFRRAGDLSVLWLPVLAGLIVGLCEEWLQWFIPARIGELRDVLLNLFAIGAGLLFCLGVAPPERFTVELRGASRRRVARTAVGTFIVVAAFLHSVHLGHEITDREAGVFRSRYTSEQLQALGALRSRQWSANPPLTWSRLSREDQYFSEGLAHVQRRNEAWAEGNVLAARHENLLLERYYAPVLDTPSYVSATGHRWPPEQKAQADAHGGPGFMIYLSDALPYPVLAWPAWALWAGVAITAALVLRLARTRA